tara:strand:- start:457 stop:606 length:150 start_codon:yes stop_codon:yes gene_type:complete
VVAFGVAIGHRIAIATLAAARIMVRQLALVISQMYIQTAVTAMFLIASM